MTSDPRSAARTKNFMKLDTGLTRPSGDHPSLVTLLIQLPRILATFVAIHYEPVKKLCV